MRSPELLGWVGLGDRMWSLPPVLSGGEQQRVAIARAVIARPQILLADEPTGNVDPGLAQRLLRMFIELNKSGTSIIIAIHDISNSHFGWERGLCKGATD
jgi:cell division transport system ATP-binding protein